MVSWVGIGKEYMKFNKDIQSNFLKRRITLLQLQLLIDPIVHMVRLDTWRLILLLSVVREWMDTLSKRSFCGTLSRVKINVTMVVIKI